MRTTTVLLFALSLSLFSAAQAKPGTAGPKSAPAQSPGADDAIKQMLRDAQPGPIHKELLQRAGDYTVTTRLIEGGTTQGKESTSTARFVPIIGGRFLMEGDGGTPGQTDFNRFRLWGYNNAAKHYEAVWVYDKNTSMMFMSGTASPDGKTVTYHAGWQKSPTETERVTVVVTQANPDKFVIRMISAAGDKGPILEETYQRVKGKK